MGSVWGLQKRGTLQKTLTLPETVAGLWKATGKSGSSSREGGREGGREAGREGGREGGRGGREGGREAGREGGMRGERVEDNDWRLMVSLHE